MKISWVGMHTMALAIVCTIIGITIFIDSSSWGINFLSIFFVCVFGVSVDYFRRNIRGYNARFCVPFKQDSIEQGCREWICEIVLSSKEPIDFTQKFGGCLIEIPLGGWFKFQGSGIRVENESSGKLFRHWRVRLHSVDWPRDDVFVEVRYGSFFQRKKERLVLKVAEAIRLLCVVTDREDPHALTLSEAVAYREQVRKQALSRLSLEHGELQETLNASRDELQAVRGEFDQISIEHEATLVQLRSCMEQMSVRNKAEKPDKDANRNLVNRISLIATSFGQLEEAILKTDRLKTTIEGRELLVQVLEGFESLYRGFNDAEYRIVHARLEVARNELNSARARNRKRGRRAETKPFTL